MLIEVLQKQGVLPIKNKNRKDNKMFKLSQEEIDKMKEEVKELRKKIERLEWFIKINEYDPNEHKVYEGGSDLQLNYEDTDNGKYNKTIKKQSPLDMYEPPFECCRNCPNNFRNNPSSGGVCSCDLPYKEMFKW
jgi:hypothetical protein